MNFAPKGVAPGPGQVAWEDRYLTADRSVIEALVRSSGRPEAWFIDNDAKIPHSTQMNAGIRQLIGDFAIAATYVNVKAEDLMALNFAHVGLREDGRCCLPDFPISEHGFSGFIYSTNDKKTWDDALQLQIDRAYRRASENAFGWASDLRTPMPIAQSRALMDSTTILHSRMRSAFPSTPPTTKNIAS